MIATEKQIVFLKSLRIKHVCSAPAVVHAFALIDAGATLPAADASSAITILLASPLAPKAQGVGKGYYSQAGVVFKVVESNAGSLYAKRLVVSGDSGRWVYAKGAYSQLTESDRLSLDEAAEFGKKFGVCCVCGKTLTDPKSIAAGIGPVCINRI